jgi:hypothetical protein
MTKINIHRFRSLTGTTTTFIFYQISFHVKLNVESWQCQPILKYNRVLINLSFSNVITVPHLNVRTYIEQTSLQQA